jgi:hypothetical protein
MDKIGGAVRVVIPSYKRADKLAGKDYFPYAVYVVPESQRDDYLRELPPERVLTCRDEEDGNTARKRNWIFKNVERPLLMMDDDVEYLVHAEAGKQQVKLSPEEAEAVIVHGFNLAHEWGCRIWGINVNVDGRNYQQYKPFSLSSVILGPFMGHLYHELKYDERMDTKDDYDMSLQALNAHRKILRMNKYAYYCKHGDNKGGMVAQRTWEREVAACKAIMRKWGRGVIKYNIEAPKKFGDLLNGRVSIPIGVV